MDQDGAGSSDEKLLCSSTCSGTSVAGADNTSPSSDSSSINSGSCAKRSRYACTFHHESNSFP